MTMTSSKPYVFRAIYDWIVDNGLTPHVLVNAAMPGVHVPEECVDDGKIVLNVSPRAVHQWYQDHEVVTFSARFNGQSRAVEIPLRAILAIYARENGKGMLFEQEPEPPPSASSDQKESAGGRRPRLQIVKQ
jgi:stringent starvation protein B